MLLGIDIGGTTISLGLVEKNKLVRKICVPSFAKDASLQETLDYLSDRIGEIIVPEVSSIGIGVPTLVDYEKGIVYNAANIKSWKEVHLKEYLQERFGVRVEVNNDANCYVLGAATVIDPGCHVVVGVTLGTGTGIGIMSDGKLVAGDNCGAGELCSLPYNGKDYESFCSRQFFDARGWDVRKAADAAKNGSAEAQRLFDEFGMHLGKLLGIIMYAYDPGCIVLGGGVANTEPLFRDSMMKSLGESYAYPHALRRLEIHSMPQEDLSLLGASQLINQ